MSNLHLWIHTDDCFAKLFNFKHFPFVFEFSVCLFLCDHFSHWIQMRQIILIKSNWEKEFLSWKILCAKEICGKEQKSEKEQIFLYISFPSLCMHRVSFERFETLSNAIVLAVWFVHTWRPETSTTNSFLLWINALLNIRWKMGNACICIRDRCFTIPLH